jgi:hypothetical protein
MPDSTKTIIEMQQTAADRQEPCNQVLDFEEPSLDPGLQLPIPAAETAQHGDDIAAARTAIQRATAQMNVIPPTAGKLLCAGTLATVLGAILYLINLGMNSFGNTASDETNTNFGFAGLVLFGLTLLCCGAGLCRMGLDHRRQQQTVNNADVRLRLLTTDDTETGTSPSPITQFSGS